MKRTILAGSLAAILLSGCGKQYQPQQQEKVVTQETTTQYTAAKPESTQPPTTTQEAPTTKTSTLEEIAGIYTVSPSGKPQRAKISYVKMKKDNDESAQLVIEYLRAGQDEPALKQLGGEAYACVPAAQFWIHTKKDNPNIISYGSYQINGKNDKGENSCGEHKQWNVKTEQDSEQYSLSEEEAAKMQKLFEYTVKTLREQEAKKKSEETAPYMVK